jgi:hypothetical protein
VNTIPLNTLFLLLINSTLHEAAYAGYS